MKFTMRYEVRIPTNLCEVDIDEVKIKEDFGSVENFILWTKNEPNSQKERNLLKKLGEKFPMDVEDYIHSNGQHIQTFKGHRFDTLKWVGEGGLENNQTQINYEKSLRFTRKDGRSVKDVIVGFE